MVEVAFYHLTKFKLEEAIPKLLEKSLQVGKRAVVQVGSEDRSEYLADYLWTYQPDSWLPHGTAKDGHPEHQPIWITHLDENLNKADFLFLGDGCMSGVRETYERCFILFDGNNDENVQKARTQWKSLKDQGHDLTYWQQTDQGGWTKKA